MSLCLILSRASYLEQLYHMVNYLNRSNTVYASGDAKLLEILLSNTPRAREESFTM